MDRDTAVGKLEQLREIKHVDRESKEQFYYALYKKKSETWISQEIRGPIHIETREGFFVLGEDWKGRVAIDSDGYPYPIAEEEFQKIYEPA